MLICAAVRDLGCCARDDSVMVRPLLLTVHRCRCPHREPSSKCAPCPDVSAKMWPGGFDDYCEEAWGCFLRGQWVMFAIPDSTSIRATCGHPTHLVEFGRPGQSAWLQPLATDHLPAHPYGSASPRSCPDSARDEIGASARKNNPGFKVHGKVKVFLTWTCCWPFLPCVSQPSLTPCVPRSCQRPT